MMKKPLESAHGKFCESLLCEKSGGGQSEFRVFVDVVLVTCEGI